MSAPLQASTSSRPPEIERLLTESAHRRAQITSEIDEADDPLALYDQFVKWTFDKYPQEYLPSSGLLELVEEATRRYKADASYKSDLRYLKLWSLFASLVDKPSIVYKFAMTNKIGIVYALLYEEYSLALERDGRHPAADEVFRAGIQRKARPLERLKKRYEEFRRRTSSKPPIPPPKPSISLPKSNGTPEADILRRQPLKNYDFPPLAPVPPRAMKPTPASASVSQTQPITTSSTGRYTHGRYAHILAPSIPGKRPEKLQLDFSLLFTPDGGEYSMPEARARSMGVLGKKWLPLPSGQRVDFNDTGAKGRAHRNFGGRKSFAGEPTITINTKEALASVFDMYNSPEKTLRVSAIPGSKHAPVRKVEPITPMATLTPRPTANENAKTPGVFKPFVDENVSRKENPGPAKFKPFVDPGATVTPSLARRALGLKEVITPAPPTSTLKPLPKSDENIFSRVFTPVAREKDQNSDTSRSPVDGPGIPAKTIKLAPFVDATPFKVFSRPPETTGEKPRISKTGVLAPYVDRDNSSLPSRTPLGDRPPLRSFVPTRMQEVTEADPSDQDDSEEMEDDDTPRANQTSHYPGSEEDEDVVRSYHGNAPLGGRFGTFDVMTPITERTFEMTTSSRLSALDGGFAEPEAIEAAERLAAELREDERDVFGRKEQPLLHRSMLDRSGTAEVPDVDGETDDEGVDVDSGVRRGSHVRMETAELFAATDLMEEKTGTLSLSDAIAVASAFNPPNPCNPFDPPIVSTLLSLLPADPGHHDLAHRDAQLLDNLQKFARKQERRSSGNTTSTRLLEELPVKLEDRSFSVYEKLGEGGFGAVFAAKDVSSKDGNEKDDDDDEDANRVALKVVRPKNLWEFYVLRKVHSSLPAKLRASVIRPQALYAFRDESFLVLDLCTQGSLLDIINCAGKAGISQQGACLDELLVMFFAIELMRLLEGLHNAGFIHGDLKIDNCLIRLEEAPGWSGMYDPTGAGGWAAKGIKLIDFGRTIDTRMFPHQQTYIAEWAVDARDCVEMREDRPWTFQADHFGLAGIIYCMLFGRYIEASSVALAAEEPRRFKIATPFKRYWQTDIWTRLFDILLNPCLARPDGRLPVSDELTIIRGEMETWLRASCNRSSNTLKGLLKKVELSVIGDS